MMSPRLLFFMAKLQCVIALTSILFSCSGPGGDKAVSTDSLAVSQADTIRESTDSISYEDLFNVETYLSNPVSDTSLVQTITADAAVLVYPTEAQAEAMKKEYGEEDFYTVADDASFYQASAIDVLDSLKINTITAERSYLKFVGNKNKWTLNVLRKGAPGWMLILFNSKKAPAIVPTAEFGLDQARDYFAK
jgi:hypothetical protein